MSFVAYHQTFSVVFFFIIIKFCLGRYFGVSSSSNHVTEERLLLLKISFFTAHDNTTHKWMPPVLLRLEVLKTTYADVIFCCCSNCETSIYKLYQLAYFKQTTHNYWFTMLSSTAIYRIKSHGLGLLSVPL